MLSHSLSFKKEFASERVNYVLTKSCLSDGVILSTIDHNHLLNLRSLSPASPDSSLKLVYDIRVETAMSPTPLTSSLKSSAVSPSSALVGSTSNTPVRIACEI